MENAYEVLYIPAIVAIVYIIMATYKKAVGTKSETLIALIPLFGCLIGGVIGAITFCASPEVIPAGNVLIAIVMGMASGFAATGVNQSGKQIKKLNSYTMKSSDTSSSKSTDGESAEEK